VVHLSLPLLPDSQPLLKLKLFFFNKKKNVS